MHKNDYDDGLWLINRENATEDERAIFLVIGYKGIDQKIIASYSAEKDAFNHSADLNDLNRDGFKSYVESVPYFDAY